MGGKTSTSSQQVTIPPEVMARYNAVNARAETAADTPFKQYSTDPSAFVAPLTQSQQAGIRQSGQYSQTAQPYFQEATSQLLGAREGAQPLLGEATGLARTSARGVSPGELQTQQFMSPYIQNVVEAQRALTERQQQAQMSGQTGQAIRSGAFGGDRSGIVAANLAKEQQLAQAGILSPLLQQGYSQALQTAQQQQGLGLSAEQANRAAQQQAAQQLAGMSGQGFAMGSQTAQQLAGLGTGAQGAGLQGAQAQMAAGQMQQQTEQAGLQALYNQFLQQQSYPFQVAQFLGNIAMGTGALSGSTTTGRQPGGFFSDSRLKEGIEKIGELHDGQPIFKFRYKGEPKEATKIGLMADEVEKDRPEAVGLAGGFRTVNYDEATKPAASMGGGVMPRHAGEPFARGGYADGGSPLPPGLGGADMSALLQAQAQMYSPYGGAGPYGGATGTGAYGGGAYVPQGTLPVTGLVTPDGSLPEQPSALESMNQMAQLGKSAGDIYAGGQKRGWWGKPEETSTTITPGGVAGAAPSAAVQEDMQAAERTAAMEAARDMERSSSGFNPKFARGGAAQADLFGRVPAQDGGAMPYSGGSGQGMSIPQQASDQSLSLDTPSLPQQGPSPFDKLTGLAGSAGSVMSGLGSMGLGKADGGEVTSGVNPYEKAKGLNIPTDIKTPEMMTGAELNKGRTPFEDVQDMARMAAMFMRDGGAVDEPTYADMLKKPEYRGLGYLKAHRGPAGTPPYAGYPEDRAGYDSGGNIAGGRHGYAVDGRVSSEPYPVSENDPGRYIDLMGGLLTNRGERIAPEDVTPRPADRMISGAQRILGLSGGESAPVSIGGPPGAQSAPVSRPTLAISGRDSSFPVPPGSALGAGSAPTPPQAGRMGRSEAAPAPRPSAPRVRPGVVPPGPSGEAVEAGRPTSAQMDALRPSGLGAAAGMSPAEQQMHFARMQAPAGVSSTGSSVAGMPAGRPGRLESLLGAGKEKIRDLGLNKAENLIPLLSGIAAMGVAPTRSLGVALASGVGAGAQAYLPTRQAMEDIRATQAGTQRVGGETALLAAQERGAQADILAKLNAQYALPSQTVVPDPNGKLVFEGKRYSVVPKASFGAQGAGQLPADFKAGVVSPEALEQIKANFTPFSSLTEGQINKNMEAFDDIQMLAANAPAEITNLQKFGTRIAGMGEGSSLDPGVLAPLKTTMLRYYDDLLATLPGEVADQFRIPAAMRDADTAVVLNKMRDELARIRASGSGGDNFQNLQLALANTPGPEMTRGAALTLVSDMMVAKQRDLDRAAYMKDYGRAVYAMTNNPGLSRGFPISESQTAWSQDQNFNVARYQQDAKVLRDALMTPGRWEAIQAGLNDPDPTRRQGNREKIGRATGNPLIYRYFIGSF